MAAGMGRWGLEITKIFDPDSPPGYPGRYPPGSRMLRAFLDDLRTLADRIKTTDQVRGFPLTWLSGHRIEIGPGLAMSAFHPFMLELPSAVSVDIRRQGPGGFDEGHGSRDSVYYVYVIGDSRGLDTTAGLISRRFEEPTLPARCDRFRRLGFLATGPSARFLRFHQFGGGSMRRFHFAEPHTATQLFASGGSTRWRTVDCGDFIPSSAWLVLFQAELAGGGGNARWARFRASGDDHDGTSYTIRSAAQVPQATTAQLEVPCSGGQKIEYRVSGTGVHLSLSVVGCDDQL